MNKEIYPLLSKINSPADLKKLSEKELLQLAKELREFIIDTISQTPGHFAGSLGVVELTIALHYVFDMPYDKIVWDVGHQAYGHKILTGRRDNFHTLRQLNGVSGFPSIFESEYDAFGVGHSSTSISAGLGMAIASQYKNEDRNIVVVIGDGAMTAGMAYEGLNNVGATNANILIILNDNNMAISPNVGALSKYLANFTASKTYNKIKEEVWKWLGKIKKVGPEVRRLVQQVETGMKSALLCESNYFEGLNLRYFGPIDGHNLNDLIKILTDLKKLKGPKLLHIKTIKGKGFKPAEENQHLWHSTSQKFDKTTGKPIIIDKGPKPPKFSHVYGETLLELAKMNDKIMGITPAMPLGSHLDIMIKEMPDRAFDVGIAEQHAVTFAAGLAISGLIPYCTIYSTFLQRAYDQLIHDVAIQNLHVVFGVDRGGLVGADGATHHGVFDLSYLRIVPNMVVAAPMDEIELRNLMYTAQLEKNKFPFAIRYPRGRGRIIDWQKPFKEIPIGKGRIIKEGKDIAILSIGAIGTQVMDATEILDSEGVSVAHYDMRFVKPLDEELLHEIFNKFDKIITVEDNVISGGFGSAVLEFAMENDYRGKIKRLGVPDKFIDHGKPEELYALCGIDAEGITKTVKEMLGINNKTTDLSHEKTFITKH